MSNQNATVLESQMSISTPTNLEWEEYYQRLAKKANSRPGVIKKLAKFIFSAERNGDYVSGFDIMHNEAQRVDNLASRLVGTDSYQQVTDKILASQEFAIKDESALEDFELLSSLCPSVVELANNGLITMAHSELDKLVSTNFKLSSNKVKRLKRALFEYSIDTIDTIVKCGNSQELLAIVEQNKLRHLGSFEGIANFPSSVIKTGTVQDKITKELEFCVDNQPNLVYQILETIESNNLLPEVVIRAFRDKHETSWGSEQSFEKTGGTNKYAGVLAVRAA